MSYLPCQNPSCKSYGRPHPNCRCHGEMAEGGEASFCARDQPHQKGCAYFADGGPVNFDDLPDEAPPEGAPQNFDDLPDEAPPADEAPNFDELPDESIEPATDPQKIGGEYEALPKPGDMSLPSSLGDAAQRMGGAGLFRTPEPEQPGEKLSDEQIKRAGEGEEKAAGMAMAMMPAAVAMGPVAKGIDALKFGPKGAAALKGAIQMGAIEGANQAQKALLGQGQPQDAVNPYLAVMIQSMFGAGGGFLSGLAGQATAKAVEGPIMKAAANAEHWLTGYGMKTEGVALPKGASEAMKAGHEFSGDAAGRIAEGIGRKGAQALTAKARMVPGVGKKFARAAEDAAGQIAGRSILKSIIGKPLEKVSEYAAPTVLRWLQNGAQGSVFHMIDYAAKVQRGESLINNSIMALMNGGEHAAFDAAKSADIEALRKHVDDGGIEQSLRDENAAQPEGFAEGGKVEAKTRAPKIHDHDHIAQNMPDQNHLIQEAKGRVMTYLSGQRPQKHAAKLAFDDEPDNREQKKNYDKALEVAVHPVGVLKHIKAGTIDPDHVKHLTSMYPELTGHLQQKINESIVQSQMDEKKPNYKVRQGLSMLMGAPLSGELVPQNIQAAQATFTPAKRNGQPQPESESGQKGSKAALSKSEQAFLTDDQARERRQQRV